MTKRKKIEMRSSREAVTFRVDLNSRQLLAAGVPALARLGAAAPDALQC